VCNAEAASVEYKDQVNFVGVAWTGSDSDFQGFIDKYSLTFPQLSDDPGAVYERFGVAAQPAMVIVKTDGTTETIVGAVDESLLDQILSEA
jgi:peroxiredoxin